MAGKSTISITFKLDGNAKGFQELTKGAEGLKAALQNTVSEAQQLKGNVINFAALATGFNAISSSVQQLHGMFADLTSAYAVQESAEKRLETVMIQRMNATREEIQSIKDLASAQQELGVIGDEVQLSGVQQLSTFLNQKSSIDTLLPAMNNLIAQQKGYAATAQDAVNIGNLIGKAMQGQTAALRRVGITFDELEEKVLKYGTESEKAAMMAQVITNNVGNMNAALAQTDSGRLQQVVNTLGDYKESIGSAVMSVQPYLAMAAQTTILASGIGTLVSGIRTLNVAMKTNLKTFAISTAAYIKNKAAILATAAAQKVTAAATALWTGAQKLLNIVLTANPISIMITAIGALAAALAYAYKHSETFRNMLNSVWEVIGPISKAIMNGLVNALSWVVEKAKKAWEWLVNLLGLGGKKAEVTVDVKTNYTDSLTKKYENADKKKEKTTSPAARHTSVNIPKIDEEKKEYDAYAKTLRGIRNNIDILNEKILDSTKEQAAVLIELRRAWEEDEAAILNQGEATDENTKKAEENKAAWMDNASTLQQIEDNVSILQERLKNATIDEAALINRQIEAWNAKADAIRNAGKEAKKEGKSIGENLLDGWQGVKGMGGSIEGITESLKGNGKAWQKVTGIVDGFIGLYQSMSGVISVIQLLTGLSWGHTAAKTAEGVAEVATSGAREGAASADALAAGTVIAANKLETASFKELAAAKYMAAHAYIPFAGFAIGAGFVASMTALVKAAGLPMLAKGGIASGPTLAYVGEYPGASSNPEVIAPLDKLRNMIGSVHEENGGRVEFKIEGRTLVGILNKENNIRRRS